MIFVASREPQPGNILVRNSRPLTGLQGLSIASRSRDRGDTIDGEAIELLVQNVVLNRNLATRDLFVTAA